MGKKHGLTKARVRVLAALGGMPHGQALNVGEICRACGSAPFAMPTIIDTLMAQHLVTIKERSPYSSSRVKITAKGRKWLEENA